MTDKIVVFVTAGNEAEAQRIARGLVEERLAACVSLLPAARSIYRWEGQVADEQECLLIIKSRRDLWEKLRAKVEGLHSYATPEIIALPIVEGAETYLDWLDESVSPAGSKGI